MSPFYTILLQLSQNSLTLAETITAKFKFSKSSLNLDYSISQYAYFDLCFCCPHLFTMMAQFLRFGWVHLLRFTYPYPPVQNLDKPYNPYLAKKS